MISHLKSLTTDLTTEFAENELEYDNVYVLMEEGRLQEYIPRVVGGLYGTFDWSYNSVSKLSTHGLDEITYMSYLKQQTLPKKVSFDGKTKEYDGPRFENQMLMKLFQEYRKGKISRIEKLIKFLNDNKISKPNLETMYDILDDAVERLEFNPNAETPLFLDGSYSQYVNKYFICPFNYLLELMYSIL
jgi:hypothetical protein